MGGCEGRLKRMLTLFIAHNKLFIAQTHIHSRIDIKPTSILNTAGYKSKDPSLASHSDEACVRPPPWVCTITLTSAVLLFLCRC